MSIDSDSNSLLPKLLFGVFAEPPFPSGEGSLTAQVNIYGSGIPANTHYAASLSFYMSAPRFSLPAEEIHSAYPAAGSSGPYQTTVASISLRSAHLPWQRWPGNSRPAQGSPTWLALILISAAEMEGSAPVTVINTTLASWTPPGGADPVLARETPVNLLSLPQTLAKTILPAYNDLTYAAHVRQEATAADKGEGDPLAVILCNRLPVPNSVNYVFLVSAEGQYTGSGNTFAWPAANANVQLPVLAAWQFSVTPAGTGFSDLMHQINMNPPVLRLPPVSPAPPGKDNPNLWLAQGYAAFPYSLRNGESTGAWYRGPLATGPISAPLTLPSPGPDALLIFDINVGMMDCTYAAAWELGKLLALQNQQFSLSLSQWKQKHAIAVTQAPRNAASAYLPVINEMDQWSQLAGQQQAFIRMNSSTSGVFSSLTPGNVTATWTGNSAALSETINDDFGISASIAFPGATYPGIAAGFSVSNATSHLNGDFSVCVWFQLIPSAGAVCQTELIQLTGTQAVNSVTLFWDNTKAQQLSLTIGSVNAAAVAFEADGEWHQFVLSSWNDSNAMTHYDVYVDGNEIMTATRAKVLLPAGTNHYSGLLLGNSYPATAKWVSRMANFRLFTWPLDAGDIALVIDNDRQYAAFYPFMNALALLKGVPFSYLVPAEAMLPPESVRFFVIDPSWVRSLLDGAYSMGRISKAQLERDKDNLLQMGLHAFPPASGFLMRSVVISDWPDMMVEAYTVNNPSAGTASIAPLRMEKLSDNVLLCIFPGTIRSVQFHLKPETLHSGVTSLTGTTGFTKKLRNPADGSPSQNSITYSFGNSFQVFSFSAMAASMQSTLSLATPLNSGSFGLQMMEGVPPIIISSPS